MRADFERDSYYPVRSYRIGDNYCAECNGVKRIATGCEGHSEDKDLLRRAVDIADAVYARRSGGTVYVDPNNDPVDGYCVGLKGYETIVDLDDCSYGDVLADIVDKLENAGHTRCDGLPVGIGWWTPAGSDGKTYLDVSVHIADRADALAFAEAADQIAIYDCASGTDIDIRYS